MNLHNVTINGAVLSSKQLCAELSILIELLGRKSYNLITMNKSFLIDNQKLMREWAWTKNNALGISPNELTLGSGLKVWWKCSRCNQEWQATVGHRSSRNQGCPYCYGRKATTGINDLATICPKLILEWHPTKNGEYTPYNITSKSGRKIWWVCSYGHEFQATPHDRVGDNTGCPYCRKKYQTSFPEQVIYYYIKKAFPNAINKYKDIFSNSMELDIFIPEIKMGIEFDGANWHKTNDEYLREKKKYDICKNNGITLIRIKEKTDNKWEDVADGIYYVSKNNNYKNLDRIIRHIIGLIDVNLTRPNTNCGIYDRFDINIEQDKPEILSYLREINNSLQEKRPDVASKWNYEKNGNLTPAMFSVSSNEIVWWKCNICGNEWKSSINSMTREGRFGCSICSNTQRGRTFTMGQVKMKGSLADNMPDLAKEWHPTKNYPLTPNDVTVGRFKPVWWLCSKCGYEWQSSPNNRKKGIGCPCCSGRVPKQGINDLETLFPQIAKEWNYEKNIDILPIEFLPKSGKMVWWKCSKCNFEWQAIIRNRTNGIKRCPNCTKKN